MTVNKAAKKWDVSTSWVRDRCRYGLIPNAEKRLLWEIDDSAEKPPCTNKFAVDLLKIISDLDSGKKANPFPGKDKDKCIATYNYLSKYSFITELNFNKDIEKEIKRAKVCSLGFDLIRKYEAALLTTTEMAGEVNSGFVKAGIKRTKTKI